MTLFCRKENVGELGISFVLYPGRAFVDIGFSFTNPGKEDVRLRRVELIRADYFPGLDRKYLHLLNGDIGGKRNVLTVGEPIEAENNTLCYFAGENNQRSLVAGGMTYADFRKSLQVSPASTKHQSELLYHALCLYVVPFGYPFRGGCKLGEQLCWRSGGDGAHC